VLARGINGIASFEFGLPTHRDTWSRWWFGVETEQRVAPKLQPGLARKALSLFQVNRRLARGGGVLPRHYPRLILFAYAFGNLAAHTATLYLYCHIGDSRFWFAIDSLGRQAAVIDPQIKPCSLECLIRQHCPPLPDRCQLQATRGQPLLEAFGTAPLRLRFGA
jgi:hypothetical protein